MFRYYVPEPVYQHLPKLYLLTALLLILVDLSPVKWMAVIALALAAVVTVRRRATYREAQRREAIRRSVAARYGKEGQALG